MRPSHRSPSGEWRPFDPIRAVIEVRGCWNIELFTALEKQLVGSYMVNYRGRVPSSTIAQLPDLLDQQAAAAPDGFLVRATVLDIRAL